MIINDNTRKKSQSNNTLIAQAALEHYSSRRTPQQAAGKSKNLLQEDAKDKDALSKTGSAAARSYLSKRLNQRSNRSVTYLRNQSATVGKHNTQAILNDKVDINARNSVSNMSKKQHGRNRTQIQGREAYANSMSRTEVKDKSAFDTNTIRVALDRHHVSNQFHSQAYPYFFRSQGPFAVYDHAQVKGYGSNLEAINGQARARFRDECDKIKEVREFERDQFDWQKKKQDMIANHNANMKKRNNLDNLQKLAAQIESDKNRQSNNYRVDRMYYKPHFGPEETDDTTLKELLKNTNMKNFVMDSLTDQRNMNHTLNANRANNEKLQDLINLEKARNMFMAEEMALQAKDTRDKLANKTNWEGQMADNLHRKTMDQLFY